jgi:phosphoenolpyruvate synthase/pyruvate phosphate dikinase
MSQNRKVERRISNIVNQIHSTVNIEQQKVSNKVQIKFFPSEEEILKIEKEIEKENFKNLIPFHKLEEEIKKEIMEKLKNEGIYLE